MRSIATLFGRSPFAPIQKHMEKVSNCVDHLVTICDALHQRNFEQIEALSLEISRLEHQADLTKNDIRNQLPKNLFLPMDRQNLLTILTIQDSIADNAEDIGMLFTLKHLKIFPDFEEDFDKFVKKNIESFNVAKKIIAALHELFQSSFGGLEAETVKNLIDDVAFKEHEADLIQKSLLKKLFNAEHELSYSEFYLWIKVLGSIGNISNLSEKLANCIRLTLETK